MYPYFVPAATAATLIICLLTLLKDRLPAKCRSFLDRACAKTHAFTRGLGDAVEEHSAVLPILLFLGFPLFLFQLVNMDLFPEICTRYISLYKLLRCRSGEITLAGIPENLKYLPGLVTYDELLPYNATYEYGAIYTFSIPFLICGIGITVKDAYQSLKNRTYGLRTVVLLLFLANFIAVVAIRTPYVHRANGLYLPIMPPSREAPLRPSLPGIYRNCQDIFELS